MNRNDHVDDIIEAWAAQWPELDTSSIAVVGRILRAARLLNREVERELGRFGLGTAEFNVISALRRQSPPHEMTPTQLSAALLFTSGGLTKVLERLEAAGLVSRGPDDADRRAVRVALTERGAAVHEEAMRAHLANQEHLLAPLDAGEREAIAAGLKRLLIAIDSESKRRSDPEALLAGPTESAS